MKYVLSQVAGMCAVSKTTVSRWVAADVFPASRDAGGRWQIDGSDLYGFLLAYGIPIPPDVRREAVAAERVKRVAGRRGASRHRELTASGADR